MVLLLAAGCAPDGDEAGNEWVGWRAAVSSDIGIARYREERHVTGTKSEWESSFVRPRATVDYTAGWGFEASAEASCFSTNDGKERWEQDGTAVSDNRLAFDGHEFRLLAGWGLSVEDYGRFSLLGGMAYREVDMERRLTGGGRETQELGLATAELEARASLPVRERGWDEMPLSFDASVSGGRLIEPRADFPGAGTIEAEGGWLVRARAGFTLRPHRNVDVFLGVFCERLEIDGATSGGAEWPDSVWSAQGFQVGIGWRF